MQLFQEKLAQNEEKIEKTRALFNKYEIPNLIKNQINDYSHKAFEVIETMEINEVSKKGLLQFGKSLMTRKV